jgi:hypothetical protein
MSRVDRRVLAWVVSLGLSCLGVAIAVRAIWPGVSDVFSSGPGVGGFSFTSVTVPSLISLPFVVGNIALSVIARRRGGRPASIGSLCLWTLGILAVLSLVVSLTPPDAIPGVSTAFFVVLLVLLALGTSLTTQLLILAVLTFVLIGGSRAPGALSQE